MIKDFSDRRWQALLQEEAEMVLHELKPGLIAKESMVARSSNLHKLSLENRWKFYRYWLRQFIDNLKTKLQIAEIEFNQIC